MLVNVGKGIELDVDIVRLGFPPESELSPVALHVVYLGIRNPVMDSHAGISTDTDNYVELSRATAEKKLAAMYAGEVRVTGTREGDPVRAEAIRLATLAIRAAIKKNAPKTGKKLADYPAKVIREKAVTLIEKYREQAEKNVADAKSADVDVDDLI